MLAEILSYLAIFVAGFLIVNEITPHFINRMHIRKFVGKDMNKFNKPEVAEFGGFLIFIGFTFSSIIAIFISTYVKTISIDMTLLLAGMTTIIAISFIGLIDDLVGWKKGIRQWQNALFPVFAAMKVRVFLYFHSAVPGILQKLLLIVLK